jgi:hypothetical protein
MAKEQYAFRLPDGITKEDLGERAKEMNITTAALLDRAIEMFMNMSPFFLQYTGGIAANLKMPEGQVIEKFMINNQTRQIAYKEVWGSTSVERMPAFTVFNGGTQLTGLELFEYCKAMQVESERLKYNNYLESTPTAYLTPGQQEDQAKLFDRQRKGIANRKEYAEDKEKQKKK